MCSYGLVIRSRNLSLVGVRMSLGIVLLFIYYGDTDLVGQFEYVSFDFVLFQKYIFVRCTLYIVNKLLFIQHLLSIGARHPPSFNKKVILLKLVAKYIAILRSYK